MADIVNLKDFRKARTRAEAEAKAAENRARFGRTKMDRLRQSQEENRARREHDGNKVERDAEDAKPDESSDDRR